jgi:hypothetical protein
VGREVSDDAVDLLQQRRRFALTKRLRDLATGMMALLTPSQFRIVAWIRTSEGC